MSSYIGLILLFLLQRLLGIVVLHGTNMHVPVCEHAVHVSEASRPKHSCRPKTIGMHKIIFLSQHV
jgi:hypothetical protein